MNEFLIITWMLVNGGKEIKLDYVAPKVPAGWRLYVLNKCSLSDPWRTVFNTPAVAGTNSVQILTLCGQSGFWTLKLAP